MLMQSFVNVLQKQYKSVEYTISSSTIQSNNTFDVEINVDINYLDYL